MMRIEALLSARLFLQPQLIGNHIYFISDLSGSLNLYVMDYGGSLPNPLLPIHTALQNPKLLSGASYCVFPELEQIVVMVDDDGDENYQPMVIPLNGGFPQPTFDNYFADYRVNLSQCDPEHNILYLGAESKTQPVWEAYQGDLESGTLQKLGQSPWGCAPSGANSEHTQVILIDEYTHGDHVVYLWDRGKQTKLLCGTPLEAREPGQIFSLNAVKNPIFTSGDKALIFRTALYSDHYGLGYISLDNPGIVKEIEIFGRAHTGRGELVSIRRLEGNRYLLKFNIEGCTWMYEGTYNPDQFTMNLGNPLVGEGELSAGVVESISYDDDSDSFILTFSKANAPLQIYTLETDRKTLRQHTHQRMLGLKEDQLGQGEEASFTSFDGTPIPARIYFPAEFLGYQGPRPLVYYLHGGPHSQERPDFSWFSMPLIHFLTLNGMAVFVPNVRGSTGYGLDYARQVIRDWGGKDRLDHVYAMSEILSEDERLDISRAGVIGRSYGGYMSLILASRHPNLWSAAVDMFGPYDLTSFMDRLPETWKPGFKLEVGDPSVEADRSQFTAMSPSTYIDQIQCPLLVIQGANDPRVVEQESRDLVEHLGDQGKAVDYLLFENEGHDILKYENKVACYNAITAFFIQHLKP